MQNLLVGETKVQGFNLPVALIQAIKDLARREQRSASGTARLALVAYVEKMEAANIERQQETAGSKSNETQSRV